MKRVEVECKRKLGRDDDEISYRHCVEELLRGNLLVRTQAREIQHRRGIITDNDWRVDEFLNPAEGGDVRHFPLNEALVDEDGNVTSAAAGGSASPDVPPPPTDAPVPAPAPPPTEPAAPPKQPPADPAKGALAVAIRKGLVAGAARCLRKEAEQARRAAKEPGEFLAWVDDFYSRHAAMVAEHCGQWVEAWAAMFGGASDYAARHVERSKAELLAAAEVSAPKLYESVDRVVSRWVGERLADVGAELLPASPDLIAGNLLADVKP